MIQSQFIAAQEMYARAYAQCLADKIEAYDSKYDEMVSLEDRSIEAQISMSIDDRIRESLVKQWEQLTGRTFPERGPQ